MLTTFFDEETRAQIYLVNFPKIIDLESGRGRIWNLHGLPQEHELLDTTLKPISH